MSIWSWIPSGLSLRCTWDESTCHRACKSCDELCDFRTVWPWSPCAVADSCALSSKKLFTEWSWIRTNGMHLVHWIDFFLTNRPTDMNMPMMHTVFVSYISFSFDTHTHSLCILLAPHSSVWISLLCALKQSLALLDNQRTVHRQHSLSLRNTQQRQLLELLKLGRRWAGIMERRKY